MRFLLTGVLLCAAAWAQDQPKPQDQSTSPPSGDASRSVVDVKAVKPTIKTSEIQNNEPFGPISRLPRYIYNDQKHIWTSPFHTSKKDAKYWAIFGTATFALIAADKHIMNELPRSRDTLAAGTWGSRIGAAYTLLPVSAGFYFLGTGTHS